MQLKVDQCLATLPSPREPAKLSAPYVMVKRALEHGMICRVGDGTASRYFVLEVGNWVGRRYYKSFQRRLHLLVTPAVE